MIVFVPPYPFELVSWDANENQEAGHLSTNKRYPVLSLAVKGPDLFALVLNDSGKLRWINTKSCKFAMMQMQVQAPAPIDLGALLKNKGRLS